MTDYQGILRLHAQGISGRSIALSLSCSRNTVSRVLQAAADRGIAWPIADTVSNQELEKMLYPSVSIERDRKMPDFEHIHKELGKSGVTLSLLWYEYSEICLQNQAVPYQYNRFCRLYTDYAHKTKATMRIHHKPAEKLEVDWAGQPAYLTNNITRAPMKVPVPQPSSSSVCLTSSGSTPDGHSTSTRQMNIPDIRSTAKNSSSPTIIPGLLR